MPMLCRWQARLHKLACAKVAYSKALHLAPHVGSTWADTAVAKWLHLQLMRSRPASSQMDPRQHQDVQTLLKGLVLRRQRRYFEYHLI